jgi:hypothetical protein
MRPYAVGQRNFFVYKTVTRAILDRGKRQAAQTFEQRNH